MNAPAAPRRRPPVPTAPPGPSSEILLAIVLVGSLVVWFPSLRAVIDGAIDLPTAMLRYALGLVFCWVAVHGLTALLRSYARTNAANRAAAAAIPRRRQTDQPDRAAAFGAPGLDADVDPLDAVAHLDSPADGSFDAASGSASTPDLGPGQPAQLDDHPT